MSEQEAPCDFVRSIDPSRDQTYRDGYEAGLEAGLYKNIAAWTTYFGLSMLAGFVLGWILGAGR